MAKAIYSTNGMKKLCLLLFVPILHAADQEPWTWKDTGGHIRTQTDLGAILSAHLRWVTSKHKEGHQVNLIKPHRGGAYRGAPHRGAHLTEGRTSLRRTSTART